MNASLCQCVDVSDTCAQTKHWQRFYQMASVLTCTSPIQGGYLLVKNSYNAKTNTGAWNQDKPVNLIKTKSAFKILFMFISRHFGLSLNIFNRKWSNIRQGKQFQTNCCFQCLLRSHAAVFSVSIRIGMLCLLFGMFYVTFNSLRHGLLV